VVAPAALAVTVSMWFALLAALVAVGWVTHEVRLRRHRHALTAAHRQAITSARPDSSDHVDSAASATGSAESGAAGRQASR
jgi:cytochrome c-type biogenesis protein CcmH/NrfF